MQMLRLVHTDAGAAERSGRMRVTAAGWSSRPVTPRLVAARDRSVHRHDDSHLIPPLFIDRGFLPSGWNLAFKTVSNVSSGIMDEAVRTGVAGMHRVWLRYYHMKYQTETRF